MRTIDSVLIEKKRGELVLSCSCWCVLFVVVVVVMSLTRDS